MSDQNGTTLSDVCEAIVDCEHKTAPTEVVGIPSIRTTDIKNGRIDFHGANKVSAVTYREWTARLEPQSGDLILAREAPVGDVGIIPPGQKACLGQRTVLLRPRPSRVFPRYLHYLLLTPGMRHELEVRASGSTVAHLNMSDIRRLELPPLPSLPEQQAIAGVLGALDDKIELNRRMNRTLEQMAAAIFKAWFVDFEPVKAKAAGATRFPTMPQPVFDALPTEFTDSPLGPIPKGWKPSTLKEQCSLVMGQSPKSEFYNVDGEGLPFHQGVRAFGDRFPTHNMFCTVPNRLADTGDVLFSVRAPVGRINVSDRPLIVGRGLAAIRHQAKAQSFLLHALKNGFKVEDSIGSGTIFASVTKKDMEEIPLLAPQAELVTAFEKTVVPVDARYALNVQESTTLAETRDALLPKLLSGEVRVGAAEKIFEEVT